MTSGTSETVTKIQEFHAPYGREIRLQDVRYETGLSLLRITIKEGRRITVFDIDAATAADWSRSMAAWAERAAR